MNLNSWEGGAGGVIRIAEQVFNISSEEYSGKKLEFVMCYDCSSGKKADAKRRGETKF